MPALCLMLQIQYYAKNYAGIIRQTLLESYFADTNYKELAKKIRSIDIFKELTFKETSVTTANFRRTDFNYI